MTIALAASLTKRFRSVHALENVDWTLETGQIQALVGPNGAGKTTLLRILAGITRPSSGRAELLGRDSRRLGPAEFVQLGFVAEGMDLPGEMTVGEWLGYLKPFYPSWSAQEERALLAQLALPADRRISSLSRGMKMKAQLAAALAFRPKVVLLDEPFSGLDPLAREEFTAGLLERAQDMTILVATHDLAEIESFATHLVYLESGRIRVNEEMQRLKERYREVEVVLSGERQYGQFPKEWMNVEVSGRLVRFIAADCTERDVRSRLGEVESVESRALGLKPIFLALAREGRRQ